MREKKVPLSVGSFEVAEDYVQGSEHDPELDLVTSSEIVVIDWVNVNRFYSSKCKNINIIKRFVWIINCITLEQNILNKAIFNYSNDFEHYNSKNPNWKLYQKSL